ncbi:hypothetical protein MCEMKE45_01384 [Candidatus Planktophila vernalis]|uniref:hypothetical protein n=1 Tax=Candidatus Planktophila vernalis TaxID=1884907 RepID=UPI003CF3E5F8
MKTKIPIVFIGEARRANEFFKDISPDMSSFCLYILEPYDSSLNQIYTELSRGFPELILGPGSAGCTLAHAQARLIIKNHYEGEPGNKNQMHGYVFEGDAKVTKYGHDKFLEFEKLFGAGIHNFQIIQLGGLKSTSGRQGQKIPWTSSLRNYFLSNIMHDLKEDILQYFKSSLKVVPGWIGGTHAYYIKLEAILLFEQQPQGFLAGIDDYYKSISLSVNWVGRCRQNLFIQSDLASLIDSSGR